MNPVSDSRAEWDMWLKRVRFVFKTLRSRAYLNLSRSHRSPYILPSLLQLQRNIVAIAVQRSTFAGPPQCNAHHCLKCTKETNPCGEFRHLYLDKLDSWLAALFAANDC